MPKLLKNAIAISILLCSTSISNSQTIGTAVSVDDTVTGNNARVLKTASSVVANEQIRSNSSGLGHFQFNDGTKMVVGPGTNIVLDNLVYNPGGSTFRKFALKSSAGAARFISGSSDAGAYEITTPVGTLGIRGTAFDMQHFRGRTYIILVDGQVEFCSNTGNCQIIRRKCDFIVADRNGLVSDPVQPKNSIFQRRDVAAFFPFISDQSDIQPDYQLRVQTCGLAGGSSYQGYKGVQSGSGANDPAIEGGGSFSGGSDQ